MRTLSLASLLALVCAACGDDDDTHAHDAAPTADGPQLPDAAPPPDAPMLDAGMALIPETPPDPLPTGDPAVTLITYNIGQIAAVLGADERRPLIIEALKAADADVICLQEVFLGYTSPAEVAAAIADVYPYAFWSWAGTTQNRNGLLIASKHPLYRGRVLDYAVQSSLFTDYMLIAAHVLTPTSYFPVMCTHLQAGLEQAEIDEKTAEIDEAIEFAQAQGYLDGPLFWMGDFNAGPDPSGQCVPGADPVCSGACTTETPIPCSEAPDEVNWNRVKVTFTDPNEGWTDCTTCRDMFIPLQLVPLYNAEPDQRIDHCFYRNLGTSQFVSSERIFDEPQMIMSGGKTLETLSDHYGVRCTFSPP